MLEKNTITKANSKTDKSFTRICKDYFKETGVDEKYRDSIKKMAWDALFEEGFLVKIDGRTHPTEAGKAFGIYEKIGFINEEFVGVYYNESALGHVKLLLAGYTETAIKANMVSPTYLKKNHESAVKAIFNGEEILLKRKWSSHVFTDNEITKLLNGEVIKFSYRDRNGDMREVTGCLTKRMGEKGLFWGFTPDFDKVTGEFEGQSVSIKSRFADHWFTIEELDDLFSGKSINIDYTDKNGYSRTTSGQLKELKGERKNYWGFEPSFAS